GVGVEKGAVDGAKFEQQAGQGVEQGDVTAGPHRDVQVTVAGGGRAPRVDNDDAQVRVGLPRRSHAVEQDGVSLRHVAAEHDDQVGEVDFLVAARRPVAAEAAAVAGDG